MSSRHPTPAHIRAALKDAKGNRDKARELLRLQGFKFSEAWWRSAVRQVVSEDNSPSGKLLTIQPKLAGRSRGPRT